MTPQDLISKAKIDYGEWLEMSSHPDQMLNGIFANRILALNEKIEYLEKRIQYANHGFRTDTGNS